MPNNTLTRLLVGIAIIAAAVLVTRVWSVRNAEEEVRRLKAIVQVYHNGAELCDRIGTSALRSTNVTDVVNCLRQLTPSTATPPWTGPPQPSDSAEGRIYDLLDKVRTLNRRAVISHLRELTGDDLGDDPLAWIKKYGPKERPQ